MGILLSLVEECSASILFQGLEEADDRSPSRAFAAGSVISGPCLTRLPENSTPKRSTLREAENLSHMTSARK